MLSKLLGLDPAASGVTFLELPPGAQTQAVKDGRADFAVVFEWDASIGVTQFGLEVVYGLADVIGSNCSSAIFATQAYLATNGDVAQHLLKRHSGGHEGDPHGAWRLRGGERQGLPGRARVRHPPRLRPDCWR